MTDKLDSTLDTPHIIFMKVNIDFILYILACLHDLVYLIKFIYWLISRKIFVNVTVTSSAYNIENEADTIIKLEGQLVLHIES